MSILIAALVLGSYVTDNDVFPASECVGPGGATFVGDACFDDNVAVELGSACDGSVDSDMQWDGDSLNVRGTTEFADDMCIAADSTTLSVGASCSTDFSIQFDGTNAIVDSSNDILFSADVTVGTMTLAEDSGASGCLIDHPVSATPADGTEQSYEMCSDGNKAFKVYSEADGSGSVDVLGVEYGGLNGGLVQCVFAQEVLTFAGNPGDASKTTSGLVPDGAFNISIAARVTTTGTNCSTAQYGDGSDVDLFGTGIAVAAGTTVDPSDYTAALVYNSVGATEVTITGDVNCYDMAVRVQARYCTMTAPTN